MERQPFYLSKRKLPSGNTVWYYYYYNQFGERTVPKSTGCKKKADAITYCVNLLRANNLENNKTKFKSYAEGFFDDGSPWYKNKMLSGGLAKNTLMSYRSSLANHILPYFGDMFIDKITTNIIREFRVYLADEKELSNKSINNIVDTCRLIFNWAIEDNIIYKNPVSSVLKALDTESNRTAFTMEQVKFLFRNEWKDKQAWLFALTGAVTGMRFSEVNGLQASQILDGYINVNQQYTNGEFKNMTKSKECRFVTIPKRLQQMLLEHGEGNDFIFYGDDFTKPAPRSTIVREIYSHYSKEMLEQKNDNLLTFHAFRYFMNTYLLSNDIRSEKVNFVIGHSDGKGMMQKLYTSWRPDMYNDVLELQDRLLDLLLGSKIN